MSQTTLSSDSDGEMGRCRGRWLQAQRSPSIIGFNIAGNLGDVLALSVEGVAVSPADIRLWEGADSDTTSVCLEVIFPKVPDKMDEGKLGEALRMALDKYLDEQRVTEFRDRLARRKEEASLRRRGGGAGDDVQEGGDSKEESWREYLKQPAQKTQVVLHGVADLGARGRRVLAVRTSMSQSAADMIGKLAYPNVFYAETDERPEADRNFQICYYGCLCFLLVLIIMWGTMLLRGLTRSSKPLSLV